MRYMLLMYSDEAVCTPSSPDMQHVVAECQAVGNEMKKAGVYVTGQALLPTATATTVRMQKGDCVTTDGPFAETKEQLGGFYLIDVKDEAEAVAWAARLPTARLGSIEVRAIWE